MGLSSEERLDGLYWSIMRLTNLRHRLLESKQKEHGRYPYGEGVHLEEIEMLLSGLWHDLLGGDRNGLHWLFGSDSSNHINHYAMSPWAVAVRGKSPRAMIYDWEPGKEMEWSENEEHKDAFNVFDSFLSLGGLIGHCDDRVMSPFYQLVYGIYQELETTLYYLRRYNDEFLTRFDSLSRTISRLNGACFCIMGSSDEFAKAYILHQIAIILYGGKHYYIAQDDDRDVVTTWALGCSIHHHISHVMHDWDIKKLADLHVELLANPGKDEFLIVRLLSFLNLAGRKFQYEHEHKRLFEMCQNHPVLKQEMVLSRINDACESCLKEHQEHKDEESNRNKEESMFDSVDIYRGY